MDEYNFQIQIVPTHIWDLKNDNVDIEVKLSNGKRYGATFFTLTNIQYIFEKYKSTGECLNGLYFWSSNMIVVEKLTLEVIDLTVRDLLNNGEFFSIFEEFVP